MKNFKISIFLLSLSLISLELIWTRIFSAEFFYTFAFLILSLAILGLGMGALFVRLFSSLNRSSVLSISLSLTGLLTICNPVFVFMIGIDFSQIITDFVMVLKLILVILLLGSSFFTGGISLALIFKNKPEQLPVLYMSDLIGAGLGVAFALLAMNIAGTPAATFLSAVPVLIAAFIISEKLGKVFPVVILVGMLAMLPFADSLLQADRQERAPVIYTHWDAMAKIKIYDYGDKYRGLNIDNIANTGINAFDGNWDIPDSLKFGFNIVDQVISGMDSCVFLSLGAGGGQDVFQALQFGATEVHAVEVIGHINELMLLGQLAEFSGHIYHDPRVQVVTEDARVYVRGFKNKFDLIYSFSSNSFAAMASGAFALAENYIFTTEAFSDYWQAMTSRGFLIMEHQFYMPKLVSEVKDALRQAGVPDPGNHFAVYDLPNMRRKMLVLSKQPLTAEFLANAFGQQIPDQYDFGQLLYPAPDSLKQNLINRIATDNWETVAADAPANISPATDDRPFIGQMGLWKNFDLQRFAKLRGYEDFLGLPLTGIILLIILAITLVLVIPLNLLPYLLKGEKLKTKPWLYFFFLGMGFMMIEVVLIQKYALFIGTSVYSIITTLITLLLFSGIGSFFTGQVNKNIIFPAILGWLFLQILLFDVIILLFGTSPLLIRIIITALMIAPLGFFMGMPFPLAGVKIGKLIDWGFAVNGSASVLGSTLVVLIAFNYGFTVALLLGGLCYLAAYLLIFTEKGWNAK